MIAQEFGHACGSRPANESLATCSNGRGRVFTKLLRPKRVTKRVTTSDVVYANLLHHLGDLVNRTEAIDESKVYAYCPPMLVG